MQNDIFFKNLSAYKFRHGVELPPLAKDDSFDFNYQHRQILKPEGIVREGDDLVLVCEYSSQDRDHVITVSLFVIRPTSYDYNQPIIVKLWSVILIL